MSVAVAPELDLAVRVVDQVRALAGAAVQAEVVVDRVALALTRFADAAIHQKTAEATTTVRLRLHVDGRTATGSTTLLDRDNLRDLVDHTTAASRLSPPDQGWPGLAAPAPLRGPGIVDAAVVSATPAQHAAQARAFVAAAGGLEATGYCRTLHWVSAFANSAGQQVSGATTEAAMEGVARTPTSAGSARVAGSHLADLDGALLGARAAAKARHGVDPVDLPPGRYEVVLEPTAVAGVLEHLALYGFNGHAINEGASFARPGAVQFDPSVTIVDDPLSGVGLPFDTEGTPKDVLVLVQAGVTSAVAHNRRTGRAAGTASTGHAVPGAAAWGPFPTNLSLLPADPPTGRPADPPTGRSAGTAVPSGATGAVADPSVAALVAQVRRGLLVTDHWHTRVLDPRSLTVTGFTRNGVWLIENGEITRPVRALRFSQSYPEALAPGAVLGVAGGATTLPSNWEMFSYRAPALRLAQWGYRPGPAAGT